MKKFGLIALCLFGLQAWAGFGVSVGGFSPTTGIEDNNALLIGANLNFKIAMIGLKVEGFYADSSGRYASELGEEFGAADIDVEAILSADVLFYPMATTFYLQLGLNYISMDASELQDLEFDQIIDNQAGIEGGLGFTFLDKLTVQGKIMYTPNAIQDDVVDTITDLDKNLFGFMVTVGWQF